MAQADSKGPAPTQLRVGLVLNGGVSLAVWISGVVHELDELRRAKPDGKGPYASALGGRHTDARIDVIAGASAGGINGALLAAAIQGTTTKDGPRPLRGADGAPLRDMWLQLGDLRRLTRSHRELEPPSLLRGDEYLLPHLQRQLDRLLVEDSASALRHPLYLYMSATDLRGTRTARFQTSDDVIEERDHRIVFRFSARPEEGLGDEAAASPPGDSMRDTLRLELANSARLARAARASSSFPGAFAPHRVSFQNDGDQGTTTTFLADGGILDNQPIRPVLDRVRLMRVDRPIRRVVLFVVPYVTKEQVQERADERRKSADSPPGLMEVVRAGGLARDLPKLESLQRAEEELSAGQAAKEATEQLLGSLGDLVPAARALFSTYREVQRTELAGTIEQWAATPEVGSGPSGERDTAGIQQNIVPMPGAPAGTAARSLEHDLPDADWDVATTAWEDGADPPAWTWGPTKAEGFARTAMSWLTLDESDDSRTNTARAAASMLAVAARSATAARRAAFARMRNGLGDLEAFSRSYVEIASERADVRRAFDRLTETLARAFDWKSAPAIAEALMAAEVCVNAAGTRPIPAPFFEFYRVSARGCVLGHPSTTPEAKLAGMELGHFAAFLKRSWRANDWMWGRLDAVRHIGRILFPGPGWHVERRRWIAARQVAVLREELPCIAAAIEDDETAGFSAVSDLSLWRRAHEQELRRIREGIADDDEVVATFKQLTLGDDPIGEETGARATVVTATGLATVGSRALSGDQSGLPGPVRGLVGATRRSASVTHTLTRVFSSWPLVGFALILLVAAIAAVLAASSAVGAAWLVPALVAIAVAGAWTGFGWLSSPPMLWRAGVLALTTAVLILGNIDVSAPGGYDDAGSWFDEDLGAEDAVWWLVVAAGLATVALVLVYAVSAPRAQRAARAVRPWIGLGLTALLALLLGRLAWDRVADEGSGWENWFENHPAVRAFLITAVVLVLLVQLIEVIEWRVKVTREGALIRTRSEMTSLAELPEPLEEGAGPRPIRRRPSES